MTTHVTTHTAATTAQLTPFERDMADQPTALAALIGCGIDADTRRLLTRPWKRIVLTGMGSSHYVALPTWRALVGTGRAAWAVDTGDLLENPGLLTPQTLLIATSQSGASGEMVELLDRIVDPHGGRVGAVVGVTAAETSPLATRSHAFVPLRSGAEATVSTKSYLNSLVVHHQLIDVFHGSDSTRDIIEGVVDDVAAVLDEDQVAGIGQQVLQGARPRTAAIGKGDSAATSLYAALITKESSKVPLEGFVGGEFRHGPYELAGPGLTAFLYAAGAPAGDTTLPTLAEDLVASGATVYAVGGPSLPGVHPIHVPQGSQLSALACGSVVAEQIAVSLARANDVVPGDFIFGSKITTAL
jgi:fructoselysine-6-P-deglycase FrlB-like protein